jgi:hypothetical protein
MARKNYYCHIPYMLRYVVDKIEGLLELDLGLPMNATLPPSTDEKSEGTARIHFEFGNTFIVKLENSRGHYGQYVRIISLRCGVCFHNPENAREWMAELQRFAGPLKWRWASREEGKAPPEYGEGKASFTLEGGALTCLSMARAHKWYRLPVYEWGDPNHPLCNEIMQRTDVGSSRPDEDSKP